MASHRPLSSRLDSISPFYVMDILARAQALERAGASIVHMEVGEPDFPTPQPILEAAEVELRKGTIRYTPALGLESLRERLADYYAQKFALQVSSSRLGLTPGASGALQLLLLALLEPGDGVLMADPGYPCNRHIVRLCGGRADLVVVDETTDYQLSAQRLQRHWQTDTKVVLLASPANPTGGVMAYDNLQSIYELVHARGAILIVDEIYQGLTYGIKDYCAAQISPEIVVINSFSKYFGMTGWRLGWFLGPDWLVSGCDKLAQNLFLAPSTLAQHAAMAAFKMQTQEILEARRQEFQSRLNLLSAALPDLGFSIAVPPQGAFYLYANASSLCEDSLHFCQQLLQTAGVALTPGLDFGCHRAHEFVRFAYTTSADQLSLGIERIQQYLNVHSLR